MWTQLSPGSVFVIPLTVLLLRGLWRVLKLCVCKQTTVLDDDILYQSLEPFYKSLTPQTRENWLREAVQNKKRLDMPKLSNESFTRMAKFKDQEETGKAKLKGVHNYDMLANSEYANLYHYVPCIYPQRNEYVISEYVDKDMRMKQVELVRMICDLAYLDEERARDIDFSVEYLHNEKGYSVDKANTIN